MSMYRQGDLLFVKINKFPKGFNVSPDKVLVRGEATGHSHRVENGEVLRGFSDVFSSRYTREIIIRSNGKTRIVHEEHNTIILPVGIFRLVVQMEYFPLTWGGPRGVFD